MRVENAIIESCEIDVDVIRGCAELGLIYPGCPCCGRKSLVMMGKDQIGSFVKCDGCGLRTDSFDDVDKAVATWNSMVMNRYLEDNDVIAQIRWVREDLEAALENSGFKPSDDNVETLVSRRLMRTIEDLSIELGWRIIDEVINDCEEELEVDGQ